MTPEPSAGGQNDDAEDSKSVPESISAATEEVLHNIFEELDQDHNGRLEPAELKVGFGYAGPCTPW